MKWKKARDIAIARCKNIAHCGNGKCTATTIATFSMHYEFNIVFTFYFLCVQLFREAILEKAMDMDK